MRKISLILICAYCMNTNADMTGAGDAAILAQLYEEFTVLMEQLDAAYEAVDISKRMEQMEELKTVRTLYEEGQAMADLIASVNEARDTLQSYRDDPVGLNRTEQELEYMKNAFGNAKDLDSMDAARAYANILADLERLSFLGKANDASKERLARGTDDLENKAITASNITIMTDLLIEKEKRDAIKRGHETSAVTEMMGNVRYSSMVKDEDNSNKKGGKR